MKKTKKSRFITIAFLMVLLLVFVAMTAVACKPPAPPANTGEKLNIKPLDDLTDYGANSKYYTVTTPIKYADNIKSEKQADLQWKQNEERKDAYKRMVDSNQHDYTSETYENWDNATSWDNNKYHYFAIPYLDDATGKWKRDNHDTTITKVFCYADMEKVMDRLSEAGVAEDEMIKLVDYIVRDDAKWKNADSDNPKYDDFNYKEGEGSAIQDFNDLDKLNDILGNWSKYSDSDGNLDGKGENKWKDLQALKRRKTNGELYKIFGDKADMFARFSIHMTAYEYEVLETVILPLYAKELEEKHKVVNPEYVIKENEDSWKTFFENLAAEEVMDLPVYSNLGDFSLVDSRIDNKRYKKTFIHFMKTAMIDFEQAVYLTAYDCDVKLNNDYKPTEFKNMMTLQGYNYQYEKNDYSVWKNLDEYIRYLELSRKDWLTGNEAIEYRDLDSRHYKKAYRYKDTFYNAYYKAQLSFQQLQEALDLAVFTYKLPDGPDGLSEDEIKNEFYGDYRQGIKIGDAKQSYIRQLQIGLNDYKGTTNTLLIADVIYLYMSDNGRLAVYNQANTEYQQAKEVYGDNNDTTQLQKVLLQCKQLGIQSFLLNLSELSKNNYETFKNFLAFQQYSYYSDWIRAGRSYQKAMVLKQEEYFRQSNRMLEEGLEKNDETHKKVLADIKEELGRKNAFYEQLSNESNSKKPYPQNSKAVNFDKIKGEIIEVNKEQDYKNYVKNKEGKDGVEKYFRDRLIKKEWPEQYRDGKSWSSVYGEGFDENGNFVEKEYSTTWQISRMLVNHDYIFRHASGEILLDLQKIKGAETTVNSYFQNYFIESGEISVEDVLSYDIQKMLAEKGKSSFQYERSNSEDITVSRNDDIASQILKIDNGKYVSGWWNDDTKSWNLPGSVQWKEQPKYNKEDKMSEGNETKRMVHEWKSDGKNYKITFIAWCIDEKCQFEVKADEKFDFNMKLYPKYKLEVKPVA